MQLFNVQGMTCGHCVRAVTQAIHRVDPTAEVKVDLATGVVQVQSTVATQALVSLISSEGYVATAQAV
ncbi:cation transporter [Pseudomonas sp. 10B1]|uniref:heavy-metal-associated domain-containing protein n=1 Tax=unclassified Pseudomonas TaxID=196821 RepID=UPI002AB46728|nr:MULTISPECIES: cation transporter [unclassified Pseudomonas]MDY7563243.1 cation transporter [Pseudomonas sp. AB6]MEA9977639.1 cation transporter [Pseudomonas sp. RTS4]MEA9993675.1 cation transporter [Pseudomonas sp. AA4]MEB0085016.1 cation transporter [Pseudomonas sp. RTI1]MEB0125119.1 cation transporter [Pseudomonas sp. CCC1.2]